MKKLISDLKALLSKIPQGKLYVSDLSIPSFEKWIAPVAAFLAGTLLAAIVGWVVAFKLMPPARKVHASNDSAVAQQKVRLPGAPQLSEFDRIFSRNLFDSSGPGEVAVEGEGCAPQKSDLPLRLKGVIYGGSSETSLVLLESTATKETDSFVLGESVPGSATISEIARERVFFIQTGCPEYLDLDAPEQFKRRVADPSKRTQAASGGDGVKGADFSEDGFERIGNDINVTKQWIERAVTLDFAKTLQDAKASPNMVGGQVKGFVLTQIRPDSVYEKMGFENGDVVRSINGIELNDAARAIQTLNAMRNETSLEVTGERGGKPFTRKVQVK